MYLQLALKQQVNNINVFCTFLYRATLVYVPELGQMVGVGVTIGVGILVGVGVSVTVTVLVIVMISEMSLHTKQ